MIGGPAGAGGRAHAFVADVTDPELGSGDRHHLERVLRLRPGEPLTVADGAGRWRLCRFGPSLEPDGPVEHEVAPSPPITVAFALTKGDRPELVVQKVTELGVDRIVPFVAERSVVRWDADKAHRQLERLRIVAREAAMQSRRAWLPEVVPVATFAEVSGLAGACLADAGGGPPDLRHPVVLIGPEGGWSEREREAPIPVLSLGPGILRSETAAIAAGCLMVALRVGLFAPQSDGHAG